MSNSRAGRARRSLGIFLPKSLRARLSRVARGIIWLLGQHGLRLELTQLEQQSSNLGMRLAELDASLAERGAELRKIEVFCEDLDSRLFARLAELDRRLIERDATLRDDLTAKINELGNLSDRLSTDLARLAGIDARLAEQAAGRELEFRKILDYHDLLNAHLALVRRPDDILLARQLMSKFHLLDKNLPDDIQEQMLRLELHERPYDEKLPYALVAVLYGKLGRAPLPDPSLSPAKFVPAGDPRSLDDLVKSAEAHARTGDPFAVYAALWQAIVRYPDTSRGWAEFARHLALRGAWSYCRTAASHALNNAKTIDAATVASLSAALSILADEGQLADLDWQSWVQKLTPTQRMRAPIVNLLLRSGDVEAASTLLPQVIKKRPKDARTWLIASRVAYEQERLADSYAYLRRALELDFPASLHEIVRVTSAAASLAAIELGKEDELADWVSETTIAYPEVNLLPARPSPEALLSAQRMRRVALEHGLPSALLITQAKSGSVSIGNIFTSGFSLPTVLYSFVHARVVLPWLADFLRGGGCYTTHLLPTQRNVDLLVQAGARTVIVNVRDPRQLLISQIEHVRTYSDQLPPSIRDRSTGDYDENIDRAMEDAFPSAVAWIDGWIKAGGKLTVNFTTFEEFVGDRERFLEKILAYYGGDQKYFHHHAAVTEHAGIDYHRRRGEVDEWRALLSPQQLKQVNMAIPDHFWEKFGWRP